MAKVGFALDWHVMKVEVKDGQMHARHYALRADGWLLSRIRTLAPNGTTLHDFGWKRARDWQGFSMRYSTPVARSNMLNSLIARGYKAQPLKVGRAARRTRE